MRRNVILLLATLSLLALTSPSPAQQKNWAKTRQDTLRVELVEIGEVGAVNSTVVTTPMIWSQDLQIIDMVPEGIHVDSGAVLVRLDRVSLATQLQGRQTELDGHRSDMQRLQTEQSTRIREMERSVEMAEQTLQLSRVQLEQLQYESASRQEQGKLEVLKAEIALKEAKTKLEAQAIIHHAEEKKQQLKILQSQNQVNETKRQLDQLTLRAPLSGMVVYHPDWNGNKPAIGEKIRPGRGVIDLPDLSRMQVKIRVNEVDAVARRKTVSAFWRKARSSPSAAMKSVWRVSTTATSPHRNSRSTATASRKPAALILMRTSIIKPRSPI